MLICKPNIRSEQNIILCHISEKMKGFIDTWKINMVFYLFNLHENMLCCVTVGLIHILPIKYCVIL